MGDWYQVIVDREVSETAAASSAASVREWLIEEGIIDKIIEDCVLGSDTGHPPGPNFMRAVDGEDDSYFLGLRTNGLEIITERTLYSSFDGNIELVCDGCSERFDPPEEYFKAVGKWLNRETPGLLACACPGCGTTRAITEWQHDPPVLYAYLGLRFWNWPLLKDSFVVDVSNRLTHSVALVAGKL